MSPTVWRTSDSVCCCFYGSRCRCVRIFFLDSCIQCFDRYYGKKPLPSSRSHQSCAAFHCFRYSFCLFPSHSLPPPHLFPFECLIPKKYKHYFFFLWNVQNTEEATTQGTIYVHFGKQQSLSSSPLPIFRISFDSMVFGWVVCHGTIYNFLVAVATLFVRVPFLLAAFTRCPQLHPFEIPITKLDYGAHKWYFTEVSIFQFSWFLSFVCRRLSVCFIFDLRAAHLQSKRIVDKKICRYFYSKLKKTFNSSRNRFV